MTELWKRFLAMCCAVVLIIATPGVNVLAEDIIYEETAVNPEGEILEESLAEQLEVEEPAVEIESENNSVDEPEIIQEDEEVAVQPDNESGQTLDTLEENDTELIIGFSRIDDSYIKLDRHISFSELSKMLPQTVQGISESGNIIDIPVTWTSDIDYESSNESYYLFWAVFDVQKYQISTEYNYEDYYPFVEVEIDTGSDEEELVGSSNGVSNIVKRAYQQAQIKWTPRKNVDGYLNSNGVLTAVYYAGTTYTGIPYGQQVNSGVYVPNSASFDTFLNAVNDAGSLFYTKRGSYTAKGLKSTYYASDCSAFASYAYGLPRMTTSTIASSSKFTKVSGNSIYNADVGDCINKSGVHVVLITDMKYNSSGTLVSVEISEQTPPKATIGTYTPAKVASMYLNNGYTLLRYNGRDSVGEPDTYTGYGPTEPPTNLSIRTDKKNYNIGENVTFTFSSNNASTLAIPIDVNGKREFFNFVNGQTTYTQSFSVPGVYGYYLYGNNSAGDATSEYKEFYVYNEKPKDLKISIDKAEYEVGEEVTFTFSSKYAKRLAIPIDVNGKREYFNIVTDQNKYKQSFSVPGVYGYFLHGNNEYGETSTEYKEFRVYNEVPKDLKISTDKEEYSVGETVKFTYSSKYAKTLAIPIDVNGKREFYNHVDGTTSYSQSFTVPGTYGYYLVATNASGVSTSEYKSFTVSASLPKDLKISTDKEEYAVGEEVKFTFSGKNVKTLAIPIDVNGKRAFYNHVDGKTTYTQKFIEPGTYGYYLVATNDYGDVATSEYKEFYVYKEKPKDLTISLNNSPIIR